MPKFGTSESNVFGIHGPIKMVGETDEVCDTCRFSSDGPHKFGIIREDHRSATLSCPNCGETKTVFPQDVKRKLSSEEIERRARLQQVANDSRAAAEEAGQKAASPKARTSAPKVKKASTKKAAKKKAPVKKKAAPKKKAPSRRK